MIEDNAPELEPATYPDVPAETPGVILESNVLVIATPPPFLDEEQMAASLDNAGIAREFEVFQFRGHGRGGKRCNGHDV